MICPLMSRPVVINDEDILDAFVDCQEENCIAWEKGSGNREVKKDTPLDEMYPYIPPHCRLFQESSGTFSKSLRNIFGRN